MKFLPHLLQYCIDYGKKGIFNFNSDIIIIIIIRHLWDGNVIKGRLISEIDCHTEVFQYVTPSLKPLNDRDHCVLRYGGCGES